MWAYDFARRIIEERPNEEVYTVASGVSPSGFVHIGNFREVVTPYFVAVALRMLGKKVRFILSIDEFDRFRKVPGNIPSEYSKYIGKPYVDIPSPFSKNESYAEFFEKRFLGELRKVGIEVECIYQAKEYRSGRYSDKIKLAMDKRYEIFDIIDSFRTQDATEGEKENYYPISVYCDNCGKETKDILSYDSKTGDFTYKCACGHTEKLNVLKARNIKLQWKVDWPMRWQAENVIFESGGMDHSTSGGSHDVAERVAKEIFGFTPPIYEPYNFIGIKGGGAKMSSSTGNVLTLTDLLNVYDKHQILWFYAKYKPMQNFNLAFDNDVIRYYSEFDRWVKMYFEGRIDEGNKDILDFTGVTQDYLNYPNFSYLATFLPIVNYSEKMLGELMQKENTDISSSYYKERLERAKYWVENYGKEYQVDLLEEKNVEFYNTLSGEEKSWVNKTIELIDREYNSSDELMTELYGVVKYLNLEPAELIKVQKRYFEILYNLLLGSKQGPKLGIFLMAVDKEKLYSLLKF